MALLNDQDCNDLKRCHISISKTPITTSFQTVLLRFISIKMHYFESISM